MIRAAGYTMDGRKSWHFWAHLPLTPVHIGAVLRRGLASFTGEATEESWLFPAEGIHVVGAGITQHHDRVIRSQRKPSIVVTHQGNTLQVDGLLQLKITQVEPFDGAISTGISKIQLLSIPVELQPTDVALVGFNPLLGLEVEQHELCRVSVDCRYIASIGRPARRVETLRARQRCELMGSKVEDANRGGGIARPSAEDDLAPVRRPVWIRLVRSFIGQQTLRSTSILRNGEDRGFAVRIKCEKSNAPSVGRPARHKSERRRIAQLQSFGSVNLAAP